MPPKKQVTREQIINQAFELVRKNGVPILTARILAKELNCSTQPIYQSFQDMNALKVELANRAVLYMHQYIEKYKETQTTEILSIILGYVQFANEESNLFQLIYASNLSGVEKKSGLINFNDSVQRNMIIYAHGIIMMKAFGTLDLNWEQIADMIKNAYECFLKNNVRNG